MRKFYKIGFCGLGSIGRRHLKNTVAYLQKNQCSFQIDLIRSGKGKTIDKDITKYVSEQYTYLEDIPEDYDVIFITNPTSLHMESIIRYQGCTRSMFIEKPITDHSDFAFKQISPDLIGYVACPLRYTSVLQYIKENIDCASAYSVRAICSTYLPDWHPDEDYRNSYSAHKEMGGGVSIDLIHEWDYLVWLFGKPEKVYSLQRKLSNLEIDSEDVAVYLGCGNEKIYELHLDYFGRQEIRKMEIFLPDETVITDIHNGTVCYGRSGRMVILSEDRDEYQMKEIEHFFSILEGECNNDNDIMTALNTLKIAKGIM